MRAATARLALAAAGLAVFGAVLPGHAATVGPRTLVIADPSGDALGGQRNLDITSVTFTTTGKTAVTVVRGKKVTTYKPNTLVVKLALAAPPSDLPVTNFQVDAQTLACGTLSLYYDGQDVASGGYVGCGGSDSAIPDDETLYFDTLPTVAGSTITWALPFATLPPEMKVGSTITDVHAFTSISEPNTGLGASSLLSDADIDNAFSTAVYKIG